MREIDGWKIYAKGFGKGFIKAVLISYLFYRSKWISLVLSSGFGFVSIFLEKKEHHRKQCYEITLQFREGLYGIAAALGAGYAMENAVEEARKDLLLLYGEDSLLAAEFLWIKQRLELNQPLEKVFLEFAKHWKSEDIMHFVQVLQTAKRTGGDLIAVTRMAAEKIGEKIEVKREIHTMIAGKKMEGRIMNMIPPGIILYFWLSSPGFLDCLYKASGRMVMTVLLALYLLAYWWSGKISDIQV
ncbi:type II secretion system protein F [bacterium D16-51]|nr:type II secretion system protein F [bacterium D16-59]RKI62101.1 type II secretion system protein F [bacterium D16-51]